MKKKTRRYEYYLTDVFGNITPTDDTEEFGRWIKYADRQIGLTRIFGITISTVALGINYNFGEGEPDIFETMIFGGAENQYCERYSTIKQAETGHKEAVWLAIKTLPKSIYEAVKF